MCAGEWEGSGDMKQIIKAVNERMRAEEDGILRWRHQSVGSSLNGGGSYAKDPRYIKINPILHSHTLGFICQGLITANMRTLVGGAVLS